jgi:tyrosine-specific transport protein
MHTFVDYAKRDVGTLRKAFIVGGFIPLAIYVLWVFFSLGACMRLDVDIFARIVGESMDLNDFIRLLSEVTANPWLGVGVWGFSFLAILTSAIGVGLGLRDIWMETLAHAIKPRLLRLWISAILTLALPLYVSMEHPGAFIAIIRFAAIFLSFIAIIFPCMVLWRFRHSNRMGSYRMWGESLIALLLFLIGIIIIGAEIYTIM